MADEDKMKYSDIIEPDDAIENLVKQIGELNKSYETMTSAIKAGADKIAQSMKSASGATKEGQKAIDEASTSASRLERAHAELKLAMSDTGKQIAWLKAQTVDANRATVEQKRYLAQSVTSYNKLQSELKQAVDLYKALTKAEREDSQMGQILLQDILDLKNGIKALDNEMKPHIKTLSEVEKAQARLSFLESAEGKQLLDLKAKISEVTNARKQSKAATDPLTEAQKRLEQARSGENQQLKLYSTLVAEANQKAKLTAIINSSAEGSYNRLSAQYALNKLKLNQMSAAQREAADTGQALEKETAAIYQQMIKLQETTGNYRLSVGNYKKAWDGLGISVSQVVRELPAAAVSLNTFFLGISNNIPMLVDEINKLRAQNKILAAEGKATTSVFRSITKSLFGWNTALVVGLTVFSMYGKQIFQWVGSMFKGRKTVMSLKDALEGVNTELEKNSAGYGKNIVSIKTLSSEWRKLSTQAEKNEWIKDNKANFDKLGIAIDSIIEAENAFVDNTDAVIGALKLRAKAVAAQELASKKYEEALVSQSKADLERTKEPGWLDSARSWFIKVGQYDETSLYDGRQREKRLSQDEISVQLQEQRIKNLEQEAKTAEADADAYFELAASFEAAAKAGLDAAGVSGVRGKKEKPEKEKRKKDLSDQINKTQLSVQKKYEESLTRLETEEFAKRRKKAVAEYNARVGELSNTYDKNKRILENEGNLYKDLTDEQKQRIVDTQKTILSTVTSYQKELNKELEDIEADRQLNELKLLEESIKLRLGAIKEGSQKELELRLGLIETQHQAALAANKKLDASQRQSDKAITAAFTKQIQRATAEARIEVFDQQQELEDARFNVIQQSEKKVKIFRLQQEKARLEELISMARDGSIDWSDVQIEAAELAVIGIENELSKIDSFIYDMREKGLGGALLTSLGFDDDQIDALKEAVSVVIEQFGDILDAEIALAEASVEAANRRVEAAQSAYEAELEARNNGYANNVAGAKKELDLERKNQREKEKMLAEAQRRQEKLNSVTQASSLVTASANLWSSFSSIPLVGPALAIAAISSMWTSFAVAKVKAKQVSAISDEYGEGGLEILEGGSHASGNDINLGVKNRRKRNMKAEGGEALAIINKKRTAKYRGILPDIIDSLNRGVFEEKYMGAFSSPDSFNVLNNSVSIDLNKIESDVEEIKKQNQTKIIQVGNKIYEIRKNTRRIIHLS